MIIENSSSFGWMLRWLCVGVELDGVRPTRVGVFFIIGDANP